MLSPKKVYIVHIYSDFSRHIEKIIEADPDVILLWSDVEYEVMTIFLKKFIEKLTEQTKRKLKCVNPKLSVDDIEIYIKNHPSHKIRKILIKN
jgi:ABC-type Fe3+-hydroxamate transport system substrate-binding protein